MGRFRFSNFAASPMSIDGTIYFSAEAAYQAGKTNDAGWKHKLAMTKNPGVAKRIGRRVPFKANWDPLDEMEKVLRAKFAPDSEWARRLMAADATELVEHNRHHDRYWGVCVCSRCGGTGENHLGLLLQRLRQELLGSAGADISAEQGKSPSAAGQGNRVVRSYLNSVQIAAELGEDPEDLLRTQRDRRSS